MHKSQEEKDLTVATLHDFLTDKRLQDSFLEAAKYVQDEALLLNKHLDVYGRHAQLARDGLNSSAIERCHIEKFGPFQITTGTGYRRQLTDEAQDRINHTYQYDRSMRTKLNVTRSALIEEGAIISRLLTKKLNILLPESASQASEEEPGLEWNLGYLVVKTLRRTANKKSKSKWSYTAFNNNEAIGHYGNEYIANGQPNPRQRVFVKLASTDNWETLVTTLIPSGTP